MALGLPTAHCADGRNLMVKLVSMYASSTAEFSCPGVQNDVTARIETSWTGFWYCAQHVFDV